MPRRPADVHAEVTGRAVDAACRAWRWLHEARRGRRGATEERRPGTLSRNAWRDVIRLRALTTPPCLADGEKLSLDRVGMETAISRTLVKGARRSPSRLRALVGQKVREVDQVLVGEIRKLLRHRAAIPEAGAALVLPHRLEQIVFALIGEPRHLLAA